MTRTASANYSASGTNFEIASADSDRFDAADVQKLAKAVEEHTHASTRGLQIPVGGLTDGSITDAKIAAANKDGVAGTASMRTLGTGSTQAAAGNHTHSAVALTSGTQDVTTSESTSSTSYTDLATSGPAVTLSPGATLSHLITVSALMNNGSGNSYMSVAIAGASAQDVDAAYHVQASNGSVQERSTLAASVASGSTHTAKYRASAGTAQFVNRRLIAVAL